MKRYNGLLAGIATVILAIAIFISSNYISRSVNTTIGPDFMPKLMAVILCIFGLLMIIREWKLLRDNRTQEAEKTDDEEQPETKSWKRFVKKYIDIIILILLIIYPVLVSTIGFMLASIIYMIGHILLMMLNQKKRNYLLVILYSIGFSAVAYLFFVKVLHVMLPSGILG